MKRIAPSAERGENMRVKLDADGLTQMPNAYSVLSLAFIFAVHLNATIIPRNWRLDRFWAGRIWNHSVGTPEQDLGMPPGAEHPHLHSS